MRTPSRGRKARWLVSSFALVALLGSSCAASPPDGVSAAPPSDPATTGSPSPAGFPVTITNCGQELTFTRPPQRAITLNQGATETMLALGLADSMIGTAYLDDQVSSQWKAAYDSVPVLSKEYPDQETVLSKSPDFLAASYASAFDAKAVGTRADLQTLGINTYVSPFACEDKTQRPKVADWAAIDSEITDIATVFGVPDRAQELIGKQQSEVDQVAKQAPAKGKKILWFDSGDKTPYVGAGQGAPQLIIDALGGTNIFAKLPGNWADGSWETVLSEDPDLIVLADASWSTAQEKIDYLSHDPALKDLTAVKNQAFLVIPFSASTPGVRNAEGVTTLAQGLAALQAN